MYKASETLAELTNQVNSTLQVGGLYEVILPIKFAGRGIAPDLDTGVILQHIKNRSNYIGSEALLFQIIKGPKGTLGRTIGLKLKTFNSHLKKRV